LLLVRCKYSARWRLWRLNNGSWRSCIRAKYHIFEHLFKGDPSFTLFYHFLIHAFVIIDIFPTFFLFAEVPL
jgi:hypothetical protein